MTDWLSNRLNTLTEAPVVTHSGVKDSLNRWHPNPTFRHREGKRNTWAGTWNSWGWHLNTLWCQADTVVMTARRHLETIQNVSYKIKVNMKLSTDWRTLRTIFQGHRANKLDIKLSYNIITRKFSPPTRFFLAPAEGWRALRTQRWFWQTNKQTDGRIMGLGELAV